MFPESADIGRQAPADAGQAFCQQVLAGFFPITFQAGAEPLDRPQAEGLTDRLGNMEGCPDPQIEHGRFHQILIRHLTQFLQEQGTYKHIDGHIASGSALTEKRGKKHLIYTGKNPGRKYRSPGFLQDLFFFFSQWLHT